MTRNVRFFSLQRLKVHELRATLRIVLGKETSWPKQSKIYSNLEADATKSFIKTSAQSVLGYLLASSLRSGDQIGIRINSLDIFVPASYFLFVVSLILLATALSFNHLSVAMSAKIKIAGKIRIPGFSVGAYDVINQQSQNGLSTPVLTSHFHKEILPTQLLMQVLFIIVSTCALIPLAAFGNFLFSEQLQLLLRSDLPITERLSSGAGILSTITAGLFVLLFHIPLPFRKDQFSIRWGFLYYLPPQKSDEEKFKRWVESQK